MPLLIVIPCLVPLSNVRLLMMNVIFKPSVAYLQMTVIYFWLKSALLQLSFFSLVLRYIGSALLWHCAFSSILVKLLISWKAFGPIAINFPWSLIDIRFESRIIIVHWVIDCTSWVASVQVFLWLGQPIKSISELWCHFFWFGVDLRFEWAVRSGCCFGNLHSHVSWPHVPWKWWSLDILTFCLFNYQPRYLIDLRVECVLFLYLLFHPAYLLLFSLVPLVQPACSVHAWLLIRRLFGRYDTLRRYPWRLMLLLQPVFYRSPT